jgi:8-oxo-dGTP pyrophosphatase MutT (NUDIX family)
MLFRDCAGGVVFHRDKVFLLQNEKEEWVLPKGRIRDNKLSTETALERVKHEAGIDADILGSVGETHYEFYSHTRRAPVANRINWYIMRAKDNCFAVNPGLQYRGGGFFSIDDALERITYSQDRGLVSVAYRHYQREFVKST